MKYSKIVLIALIGVAFASCKDDYDAGSVPGHQLAGEWYVQTYSGGTAVVGHERISTYNTAAGDGKQIWLDDHGHIWPMKGKIDADADGKSFAGTGDNIEMSIFSYDTADIIRDEDVDPIDSVTETFEGYQTMTISGGTIIEDGGKSKTGVVTDSIYFKGTFTDDPGEEYEFSGHRRTGFNEDDY